VLNRIASLPLPALSQKQWDAVCRTGALMALGSFSPAFPMMNWVVQPYLDLKALASAQTAKPAVMQFIHRIEASRTSAMQDLVVPLILCLMVSALYLVLVSRLGVRFARWITTLHPPLLKPSV
jgi:hypothetical protein